MTQLTLDVLRRAVTEDVVAIRGHATLEPAGGPADKVFPPTHSVDERRAKSRYAFETRLVDGRELTCVLLDSVQSQANRMEESLQAIWADRRIRLPVIAVDFSAVAPDIGVVTSLTAPHRIADALLRDSLLDGTPFRLSDLGRSFTDSTVRNASGLFKVCPTGLVFGMWDSTGPRGGLGSKFARALVSEIIGVGATAGIKTASRIDPVGIVNKAAEAFVSEEPSEGWTLDPAKAKKDKNGKPIKVGDGRLTEVNHSNIPPTLDELAGGVTIDHAEHTVVLSLATLRKLQFGGGDVEVRTMLASLGLVAILGAQSRGHDLRSRCLLVPRKGHGLRLEMVRRDGERQDVGIDLESAIGVYGDAVAALPPHLGITTAPGEPIATLAPSPKLAFLVERSRELAATGADLDGK